MHELIEQYASDLKIGLTVGDYTYEGFLFKFIQELRDEGIIQIIG